MKTLQTKTAVFILFMTFGYVVQAQTNTFARYDTAGINVESIINAIDKLEEAIKKLDKTKLDELSDKAIDATRDAVASINWNNIKREASEGLHEAHTALQKIDWSEMGNQLTNAINEASAAINSINWDKIGKDIQKASEKIDKVIKDKQQR